jgi:uncharacterized membrane protein YfcA
VEYSIVAVVALTAVMAGGFAQSVTGMGFSLIAAPALIALLGPREGVATVVLLGTITALVPLLRTWREVRVRHTALGLVPALLATPVIAFAIRGVDQHVLAVLSGSAIVLAVASLALGLRSNRLRGPRAAVGAGVASATLNVVGGVGGPPVGLYVANAGWEGRVSRPSMQAFFVVQGLATVAALGVVAPAWPLLLASLAGTVTGTVIAERVPNAVARFGVLGAAGGGGLLLVLGNV